MTSEDSTTTIQANDTQSLLERLSELEEQVGNLRRLEEAVRRNAQMFESLLSGSRDGITLTTADGTLIRIVKSILGYAPAALAGSSLLSLTHPDDVPLMLASYRRLVVERAGQVAHELRLKRPDGSYVWVAGTVTDMLENPNVMAIVHNYRDVTDRRQLETAALEREVLARNSPFAFFSRTCEGLVQSWSPLAEALFGYMPAEVVGQDAVMLLGSGDDAHVLTQTAGAQPWRRIPHQHKSGAVLDLEVALIPLHQGGLVRGVAHLCRHPESISK